MRRIKRIIVHCSDSGFGNAHLIDQWHKERGWRSIGYHYVILNGRPIFGKPYNRHYDGIVEPGRPVEKIGAHVDGKNRDSIGVCLIGRNHFTALQLLVSLPDLLRKLTTQHKVPVERINAHYEYSNLKTCPNIDVRLIRELAAFEVDPQVFV